MTCCRGNPGENARSPEICEPANVWFVSLSIGAIKEQMLRLAIALAVLKH